MNTAKDAAELVTRLKSEGRSRAEIIQALTACCLGWPYVFGAYGQACTPAQRNKFAGYRQDHAAAIIGACPVLSGKAASCDTCDWNGTLIDDCRGLTRLMLQLAGLSLYGGTVTAQWEYGPNWVKKGPIEEMPRGLVCCVFRPSHTGMYVGNDTVRHCGGRKGQVVEEKLPGTPRWERFGIPAGLYTNDELRKAGVNVDTAKNIPTLRRGAEGDLVEELQAILNAKFGFALNIDGDFGINTEAAVKAFQKSKGLTVDGIVGPKTRAALGLVFDQDTNVPGKTAQDVPDTNVGNNASRIWDGLSHGINNPYAVAGIMGNLYAESSLNPNNLTSNGNKALGMTDAEYTAAVDNGAYTADQFANDGYAYGLAQWCYRTRKAALLAHVKKLGASIGDLAAQISFLLAELLTYKSVWNTITNAASVQEASDAVLLGYEKPANQSDSVKRLRASYGQKYFDLYAAVDPPDENNTIPDTGDTVPPDAAPADTVLLSRTQLIEIRACLADALSIVDKALKGSE